MLIQEGPGSIFQNLSESIKLRVAEFSAEEDLLQGLRNFVEQRTAEAKSNLITLLSKQITVSYLEGATDAADEVSYNEHIGMKGLDPVIDSLAPKLDEAFGNLSGELTDIIDAGIWENKSYATIKKELQTALKGGWGNTITFDSVGKTRRYIHIDPDGSLRWMEKTIQRTITLPTDTYAETLSRTHLKAAYAHGRQQTYIESGRKGWVYMSVADERTRPEHLALHGRVFIFGTEESDMALEVLKDYNCRCRQKAWFDDKELDTNPEVYEKQRKKWAKKLLKELPDSKKDSSVSKFLKEIAGGEDAEEKSFEKILFQKELEIKARATEKAILLNEDGAILLEKGGTKSQVGFKQSELDKMYGQILTHNHPNGSSFSPMDLSTAGHVNLKEIRAVGKEYRYSMKPPEGHETFTSEMVADIESQFKIEKDKLYGKYYGRVMNNEMTSKDAWMEHSHEIWNSIANSRGFLYSRVVWD